MKGQAHGLAFSRAFRDQYPELVSGIDWQTDIPLTPSPCYVNVKWYREVGSCFFPPVVLL